MKNKLALLCTLFLLVALAPAQAGTWRSTSGNMYHFYPGGGMTAYIQGTAYNGRWWWTNNPYEFQWNAGRDTLTVQIKGQGAVCLQRGYNPTYWTQIAARGSEDEKPDTNSWFMEQVAP